MASCVNRQAKRNGLIVASSRARAAFSHGVTACTIAFLGISFGVKALVPNVENDRKVQEYVIDPQIWSPAVDIRWPNPESKTVVVYYSADEVVEKFGLHREADLREKLSEPQMRAFFMMQYGFLYQSMRHSTLLRSTTAPRLG